MLAAGVDMRIFNPVETAERAPRARDLPYVKGCFERWAQWCAGSDLRQTCSIGRLIQGVKSNICPRWLDDIMARRAHDPYCQECHGTGRVEITLDTVPKFIPRICPVCENRRAANEATSKFLGKDCFRCNGLGWIVVPKMNVNPAGIRSTRYVGAKPPSDVCMLIEEMVGAWRESDDTIWHARVIVREYFYNGTQQQKAAQLKVSESFFKKRLREGYYLAECMLDEKMPRAC